MKPVIEQHGETLTSLSATPVPMGISDDPEDALMILNVLSNSLYTDKIAAVLREYGVNGIDANIEAGKADKPIVVRLPNKLEPTLCIRDHGGGMDEGQILHTFCKLGRSTKRGSNAFTGMLGIGSKAGFAYGDSFMIASFVKGEKIIYNAFRDKGVPRLALMHCEPTTESDGIEVRVPVRVSDIEEFVKKAERVFRYFKVLPEIHGAKIEFNRNPPQITGANWRYIGDSHSIAVMGNVGYDIKSASMGGIEQKFSSLLDLGVELDFDIGELEIAANREGLQYKDHTRGVILDRLKQVAEEIGKSFSDQVAKAGSLWEARVLYGDNFEKMGTVSYGMRTLKEVISNDVVWNGVKVGSSRFDLPHNFAGVLTWSITENWNHRLRRSANVWDIHAHSKTTLIVNDLSSGKSSPARERGYMQAHPGYHLIIFTFTDDKVKKEYLKKAGLDNAPMVNLSSITPVASVSAGSSPSAHRSKHSAKVFVLDETRTDYSSTNSVWWNTAEIDLKKDSGVYVEIFEFRALEPTQLYSDASYLQEKVKGLRAAGLIKSPLYGFKKDRLDKLGPKWVPLAKHAQDQVEELIRKKGLAQELADYLAAASYIHMFDSKHAGLMPRGSLARRWLEEQHRMMNPKTSINLLMFLHKKVGEPWVKCSAVPAPTIDLKKMEAEVWKTYPMIQEWDSYGVGRCKSVSEDTMKIFAEYVRIIKL